MTETYTPTATEPPTPLVEDELRRIDAYWRAANYLSVGQIYMLDNPLLREALKARARQAAPARPLRHRAWAQPGSTSSCDQARGPSLL